MNKNNLNIGLLINNIDNPYQNSLFKNIIDCIKELGHNLIIVSGNADSTSTNKKRIFDTINEMPIFKNIDGLIISSSILNNTYNYESFNKFIDNYKNIIPMVCISHKPEKIATIVIDNDIGIKDLIDHLVFHHNYKKFAFIKGPETNFNSSDIFNSFIKILKINELKINKELIINGNLTYQSGYSAAEKLLKKNIDFDVIIASNDLMALGALKALKKNGIMVPINKAIIGFDDMDINWFSKTSLTSIKQPIYEQAKIALTLIINKILKKKTSELIKIPTFLKIKESCGCLPGNNFVISNQIKVRHMDEISESINKLRKTMVSFIQTLCHTIEARDPYTAGHQKRVSNIARSIAQQLNLSSDQIESVRMAALIHDLGKIFIPTEILNKPGKLKSNEFNLIKDHPVLGYNILKDIEFPWPIANIILQHHEKINGTGYPKGLHNRDILIEAKILCVADVVEAISSHRPYRPSLGINEAINEISKNSGKIYDSDAVNACIEILKKNKIKLKKENYQPNFLYQKSILSEQLPINPF